MRGKKFFRTKASVMVCNASATLFVLIGIMTYITYRYAFQARAATEEIPFDIITTLSLMNVVPAIGYKIRQINVDQLIGNTTSLYYHLEELRYIRTSFNSDAGAFSLLSSRVQGQSKNQKKAAGGSAAAAAAAAASSGSPSNNLFDVQTNELGLGFNILHLHLGDNIPTMDDDKVKLNEYIKNIYEYFRHESQKFLDVLVEYYSNPLNEMILAYYVFMPAKVLLLALFIYRIFSAISVLNRAKISFEEYSVARRGFPLLILFCALAASSVFQFKTFSEFEENTHSTLNLSYTLINRSADLRYAVAFLFEAIYFANPKYDGQNDIVQYAYSRVEKNEDHVLQTLKGNINTFSMHFDQFYQELKHMQQEFQCDEYFEFYFDMENCDEFCETKLRLYNKQKEQISKSQWTSESREFVCNLPTVRYNESPVNGISANIKGVKTHLRQVREEWNQMILNTKSDTQIRDKERANHEFMYHAYAAFPEAMLYNVRLHNDQLVRYLSSTYKDFQKSFDEDIYYVLFLDLAIVSVFLLFWVFYYKSLNKHLHETKSKFQSVSEVNPVAD